MSFNDYVTVSGTAPYYTPHPSSSGSSVTPWNIAVPASLTPVTTGGAWTDSAASGYGVDQLTSSGAQNDTATWKVLLGAGTWSIELLHITGTNRGIYTVTIDAASLTSLGGGSDTVDGYSAGGAHTKSRINGIVLASPDAVRAVKINMATKNGAASNYFAVFEGFNFVRTA